MVYQAPLSLGFSRQEYWSGLLFPFAGYLPDQGIQHAAPALAGSFFTTEPPKKACHEGLLRKIWSHPGWARAHTGTQHAVSPAQLQVMCAVITGQWAKVYRCEWAKVDQWAKVYDMKNWVIRKYPDAGKDWRQEGKGRTENQVVEWHHRLDGHEFEQALGVGDGQGSLECCRLWGCKELDTTEWLNWTEQKYCKERSHGAPFL